MRTPRRARPPTARSAAATRRWIDERRFATFADGVLTVEHDHGFFTTCTVTLVEAMRAPAPVTRIDSSSAFPLYREDSTGCIWDRFFAPPRPPLPTPDPAADLQGLPWSANGPARSLDLDALRPWVDAYFRPSEAVRARADDLAERYVVDPRRTVAVWVRGTDKVEEIRPSSLTRYVRSVRAALRHGGVDRVLVQSDQAQVRDALLERFGDAAFCIAELPVTSGSEGLHLQDLPGRERHAVDLLATVVLMSTFERLVLHSGNCAFWTILLRGDVDGVRQLR